MHMRGSLLCKDLLRGSLRGRWLLSRSHCGRRLLNGQLLSRILLDERLLNRRDQAVGHYGRLLVYGSGLLELEIAAEEVEDRNGLASRQRSRGGRADLNLWTLV